MHLGITPFSLLMFENPKPTMNNHQTVRRGGAGEDNGFKHRGKPIFGLESLAYTFLLLSVFMEPFGVAHLCNMKGLLISNKLDKLENVLDMGKV